MQYPKQDRSQGSHQYLCQGITKVDEYYCFYDHPSNFED